MRKISLLERFAVNVLTPVDAIVDALPYPHERWRVFFKQFVPSMKYMANVKNEAYANLVEKLQEKGPRKRLLEEYMNNPCGRIQMRVACFKGYISSKDYNTARKQYPFKKMVDSFFEREK